MGAYDPGPKVVNCYFISAFLNLGPLGDILVDLEFLKNYLNLITHDSTESICQTYQYLSLVCITLAPEYFP